METTEKESREENMPRNEGEKTREVKAKKTQENNSAKGKN